MYRRNTDLVNRFQVQLQDRGGGDFDIVLRYETIGWTSGSSSADSGACRPCWHHSGCWRRSGCALQSCRPIWPILILPWVIPALPGCGFTDRMRGGTVAGVSPARGLVLTGTPATDMLQGGSSSDILTGLAGADVLRGDAGADTLQGGWSRYAEWRRWG